MLIPHNPHILQSFLWWETFRYYFISNNKIFNLRSFPFLFFLFNFHIFKRKGYLLIFFCFFLVKIVKLSSINKFIKLIYTFKLKPYYLSCIKYIFIFQSIGKHFHKKHIFSDTCNNKGIVPHFYNIIPTNRLSIF